MIGSFLVLPEAPFSASNGGAHVECKSRADWLVGMIMGACDHARQSVRSTAFGHGKKYIDDLCYEVMSIKERRNGKYGMQNSLSKLIERISGEHSNGDPKVRNGFYAVCREFVEAKNVSIQDENVANVRLSQDRNSQSTISKIGCLVSVAFPIRKLHICKHMPRSSSAGKQASEQERHEKCAIRSLSQYSDREHKNLMKRAKVMFVGYTDMRVVCNRLSVALLTQSGFPLQQCLAYAEGPSIRIEFIFPIGHPIEYYEDYIMGICGQEFTDAERVDKYERHQAVMARASNPNARCRSGRCKSAIDALRVCGQHHNCRRVQRFTRQCPVFAHGCDGECICLFGIDRSPESPSDAPCVIFVRDGCNRRTEIANINTHEHVYRECGMDDLQGIDEITNEFVRREGVLPSPPNLLFENWMLAEHKQIRWVASPLVFEA